MRRYLRILLAGRTLRYGHLPAQPFLRLLFALRLDLLFSDRHTLLYSLRYSARGSLSIPARSTVSSLRALLSLPNRSVAPASLANPMRFRPFLLKSCTSVWRTSELATSLAPNMAERINPIRCFKRFCGGFNLGKCLSVRIETPSKLEHLAFWLNQLCYICALLSTFSVLCACD